MRLSSCFCQTRACVRAGGKSRNLAITAYPLLGRCSLTCQPAFHQPHPHLHLHLPLFCSISLLSAKQRRGSLISLTCRRNKGSSAIASPLYVHSASKHDPWRRHHCRSFLGLHAGQHENTVYVILFRVGWRQLFFSRASCGWHFSPIYADVDSHYIYLPYFQPSQHKGTHKLA